MMTLTMTMRMPWLILLALAWRTVAQVPQAHAYLAGRQDRNLPLFVFVGLSDADFTSCASASFDWVYTGPNDPVSIFITNIGVNQTTTTSLRPLPTFSDSSSHIVRSIYRRDDVNISLTSSINPRVGHLDLTSLVIPRGSYQLVVVTNSISPHAIANSSTFTVQEGTNTACLSSSPTSSSLTFSTFTSSGLASITSTDLSSPSISPTAVGEVSSIHVNKGAIAGGVVAGALVLVVVAVLYFCVTHSKRSRTHSRHPDGPHSHASTPSSFGFGAHVSRNGSGHWGGLASVDSHAPLNDTKSQRSYVNTRRHLNGHDDTTSYLSRSGSLKFGGYASPSEEKFASPPSDEMVLSTLPYRGPEPHFYVPNDNLRSYSMTSTNPSEKRHSQSHAWRTSLDSSSTHAQTLFSNPPTAQKPPRKTTRKPVPVYDESSTTSPVSSTPPSSSTTPFADPVLSYPAPVAAGHYSTRAERESVKSQSSKKSRTKSKARDRDRDRSNPSSTNASEEGGQQDLAHKNSFGPGGLEGKQLHYLIPDMPMRRQ